MNPAPAFLRQIPAACATATMLAPRRPTTASAAPAPINVDQAPATLSVNLDTRRVILSKELCRQLNLSHGHKLELIPPARRGGIWLLDTKPRVGKALKHTAASRPNFMATHYISRDVMFDGIALHHLVTLTLRGETATAGLYELEWK